VSNFQNGEEQNIQKCGFFMGVKHPLILREDHKFQVSENEILSKIFGSKKYKVGEKFRILYKEELSCLYRSTIIVKIVKCRKLR